MASVRNLKKGIDYLVSEVISDCYTCLLVNSDKNKDEVFDIVEAAVELRNSLIVRANHPAEKHNRKLCKKHYQQLSFDMFNGVDTLFERLSNCCK